MNIVKATNAESVEIINTVECIETPIQKMTYLNTLPTNKIKNALRFAIVYKSVIRTYLEKIGENCNSMAETIKGMTKEQSIALLLELLMFVYQLSDQENHLE